MTTAVNLAFKIHFHVHSIATSSIFYIPATIFFVFKVNNDNQLLTFIFWYELTFIFNFFSYHCPPLPVFLSNNCCFTEFLEKILDILEMLTLMLSVSRSEKWENLYKTCLEIMLLVGEFSHPSLDIIFSATFTIWGGRHVLH